MYSFGDHGQWPIQVSGKLSALEKQVSSVSLVLSLTLQILSLPSL